MLRAQAGRGAVFDVLKNQFLKTLHHDGSESHRAVVVAKTQQTFEVKGHWWLS